MHSYCWGDRLIPYSVIEKKTTHATVEIDNQPRNIPLSKILGWCEWPYQKGDRVRVLMGSFWHSGTVGEGLSVELDNGRACPIWSANNVRSLYVPPTAQVGELEIEPKPKRKKKLPQLLPGEQLDLVELPNPGTLDIGTEVRHAKYWPNTVGTIAGLGEYWGKAIAWVEYPVGPLYPASLESLIII